MAEPDPFLDAAAGRGAAQATPESGADMPQRRRREAAVKDFLRIKVLSMGDGHTGKSCLIKRYCEQRVRRRCRARPPARCRARRA